MQVTAEEAGGDACLVLGWPGNAEVIGAYAWAHEMSSGKDTPSGLFKSDADLKNDKDKQIFTFAENNLLSPDDGNGEDAGKAHCLKIGKYIAADYYVSEGAEDKESAGDMSISRYVKIFDRDGSGYADVKPEESWVMLPQAS